MFLRQKTQREVGDTSLRDWSWRGFVALSSYAARPSLWLQVPGCSQDQLVPGGDREAEEGRAEMMLLQGRKLSSAGKVVSVEYISGAWPDSPEIR